MLKIVNQSLINSCHLTAQDGGYSINATINSTDHPKQYKYTFDYTVLTNAPTWSDPVYVIVSQHGKDVHYEAVVQYPRPTTLPSAVVRTQLAVEKAVNNYLAQNNLDTAFQIT